MTRLLTLLIVTLWLSGCGTTSSDCPPLKTYSAAFQDRLADELAALPSGSALGVAMVDYATLRAMIRACR